MHPVEIVYIGICGLLYCFSICYIVVQTLVFLLDAPFLMMAWAPTGCQRRCSPE